MAKIDPKMHVLWESLKEPLRLAVLAVIAWLLTVIVPQLDPKWIPVITAVLRWADKYVYEFGKASGSKSDYKGLTGF